MEKDNIGLPTQKRQAIISRRTILKCISIGGISGIAMNLEGSSPGNVVQARELQAVLQPYVEPARGDTANRIPEYPLRGQVAVAGNSRITHMPHSNIAFAVVHAGFVAGELSKWRRQFNAEEPDTMHPGEEEQAVLDIASGSLGSIPAHQARMARLLAALATTERPVLSYIEEPDLYNAALPSKPLQPPAQAFQIATLEASGYPAPTVSYIHGDKVHTDQQETYSLYSAMLDAGVETVFVAGEYSFNPWSKQSACLGGVALSLLDEGFGVRGIEGAVYPTRPQKGIERDSELAYALYDNSITLHEAVHMTKNA